MRRAESVFLLGEKAKEFKKRERRLDGGKGRERRLCVCVLSV
jgi:hypothetical protein